MYDGLYYCLSVFEFNTVRLFFLSNLAGEDKKLVKAAEMDKGFKSLSPLTCKVSQTRDSIQSGLVRSALYAFDLVSVVISL